MRTVINRVKTAQQELGLLPPDAELKAMGQTSYFPRVYKVGKLLVNAINSAICWLTGGHVVKKTMSREDAEIAADTQLTVLSGLKFRRNSPTSLW